MHNLIWKGDESRQALSKKEKKLLQAIIASGGNESIADLCKRVKVSTKTYYRMINNPGLKSLLPSAIDFLLGQQLIPVIQIIVKKAMDGSAKHSELLLKISGLISADETKILQVFGKNDGEQLLLTEGQINKMLGAK